MPLGRLLLAEDDPTQARALSARLRREGWLVDVVAQGDFALSQAKTGVHDAVLLDMRLPVVDGLGVLRGLQCYPDAPAVLFMSGFLDSQTTMAALTAGASEVLEKPIAPQRLLDLLLDVVRRRRIAVGAPASKQREVDEIIGSSAHASTLRDQVASAARFERVSTMIVGETGTGKELVARAIHRLSGAEGSMVSINCASLAENLFESEIFGHEAGAFTGARGARVGLLQAAANGTVFLDEVGEMPQAQQAKLLRTLENRSFRRLGSNEEIPLCARIISATNRVLRGRGDEPVRPDLFFRLAVHTIHTAPLAEHPEDIGPLARHFLTEFASLHLGAPTELSARALEVLCEHDWPGNVRELRGVVQSAAMRVTSGVLGVGDVVSVLVGRGWKAKQPSWSEAAPSLAERDPASIVEFTPAAVPRSKPRVGLRELERDLIHRAFTEAGGNLSRTARQLSIPRSTLRDKLKRYGML